MPETSKRLAMLHSCNAANEAIAKDWTDLVIVDIAEGIKVVVVSQSLTDTISQLPAFRKRANIGVCINSTPFMTPLSVAEINEILVNTFGIVQLVQIKEESAFYWPK